ncbi:MAG TPA: hypothetical protein VIK71_00345 [Flavobacteriales bacterium]
MRMFITRVVFLASLFVWITPTQVVCQTSIETNQPISKKSLKGFLDNIQNDENGHIHITYKTKGGKKDEVIYERYSFDNNLNFVGTFDIKEEKEAYPPMEREGFYAYVGGTTSFDVLSQKLKIQKVKFNYQWNYKNQRYEVKSVRTLDIIKPRNDDGKVFHGCAAYYSNDYNKSGLFILAKSTSKNSENDTYQILLFDDQLMLKEKALNLQSGYTLVYCEQLPNDEVVAIFAPNKGSADPSRYIYFRLDLEGNELSRIEFNAPKAAVIISAAHEQDGYVYFFGTSGKKSNNSFDQVYSEYSPIYNPGYTGLGRNLVDFKWQKALNTEMENFHIFKFSNRAFEFASSTPVKEFKQKFITAPKDKGASPYNGKRFAVYNFLVTEEGDYLISGQLTDRTRLGDQLVEAYHDVLCFHFDSKGNLKAQYGIGKASNNKKNIIFGNDQDLILSADGKSLYWVMYEVKGVKGYESFMDAYNGRVTFYPRYYPRITKIDLASNTMGAILVPGEGKYFLKRGKNRIWDADTRSITYIGNDEKYKAIWLSRVNMP